jgi:hypothetical protein
MSEAFLSRWSKRKQEAKAVKLADEAETLPPPAEQEDKPVAATEPPADLPAIGSLEADSDYSGFLRPGVSADLRQQALQRLWASNPSMMAPEVMDLHMGDYTSPMSAEVVKTAWRLGKGVLDAAELAAEKEAAENGADAPKGEQT